MQTSGHASPAFSAACERNKGPILEVLGQHLPNGANVLEVGSGTGQHAVYFAGQLPTISWQPTDTGEYLQLLRARLAAERPANLAPAIDLNVCMQPWPVGTCSAVFSANTLHFMSEGCVRDFFRGAAEVLEASGMLLVYGPFRYAGRYTSPSNARFDERLKAADPERGVRDFEWVDELAAARQFSLVADVDMPANNQLLVWRRRAAG